MNADTARGPPDTHQITVSSQIFFEESTPSIQSILPSSVSVFLSAFISLYRLLSAFYPLTPAAMPVVRVYVPTFSR